MCWNEMWASGGARTEDLIIRREGIRSSVIGVVKPFMGGFSFSVREKRYGVDSGSWIVGGRSWYVVLGFGMCRSVEVELTIAVEARTAALNGLSIDMQERPTAVMRVVVGRQGWQGRYCQG